MSSSPQAAQEDVGSVSSSSATFKPPADSGIKFSRRKKKENPSVGLVGAALTSDGDGLSDLSRRSQIFRDKLIEEFRLLENRSSDSRNASDPSYDTRDFEREPHLLTQALIDNPDQLVRFKNFKRTEPAGEDEFVTDKRLTRIKNINSVPVGVWCNYITSHIYFQNFILALIVANSITLGIQVETPRASYEVIQVLEILDNLFLMFFILEILLKWGDNFYTFWNSRWNVFDFFITALSAWPVGGGEANLQIFRTFRIFRALRSLKLIARFHNLRVIVRTIAEAFRSMAFIMLLLGIVSYIYVVMAMNIFSEYTNAQEDVLYREKFKTFSDGLLTLFQLLTLDQWFSLHNDMSRLADPTLTTFFYVSWVCIGAFIFRNIIVGVMVKNFQLAQQEMMKSDEVRAKQKRLVHMQRRLREQLQRMKENEDGGGGDADTSFYNEGDRDRDKEKEGDRDADKDKDNQTQSLLREIDSLIAAHRGIGENWAGSGGVGASRVRDGTLVRGPLQIPASIDSSLRASDAGHVKAATVTMRVPDVIWPRDSLFNYLQTMEQWQENMAEYDELQQLAAWCLHELHDK